MICNRLNAGSKTSFTAGESPGMWALILNVIASGLIMRSSAEVSSHERAQEFAVDSFSHSPLD
jgi:hypothetical protein